MSNYEFSQITACSSDRDIAAAWLLMVQLRTHLDETNYVANVRQLFKTGYCQLLISDSAAPVGVAGYKCLNNLAWGSYLYVDDLVIDKSQRSSGFGRALMRRLFVIAKQQGCTQVHLDCGVQRFDSHRFYMNLGMKIKSHHFANELG